MPRSWKEHWSRGPSSLAERFNALVPRDGATLLASIGLRPADEPVDHESLENRVFSYALEGGERIVLKVYRPHRWPREGLQEELDFIEELLAEGIPTVRPIDLPAGGQLGTWQGMHYALYEFVEGDQDRTRPLTVEELRELGRLAARIHRVGERRPALHRMPLEPHGMGLDNLALLQQGDLIPKDLLPRYADAASALVERAVAAFRDVPLLRVHGDLGNWNLIWTKPGPVVMDFDDFALAPAVQDLATLHFGLVTPWGDPRTDADALARVQTCFLDGYRELRDLPHEDTRPQRHLRGLRCIWFDAWVQSRLHDPRFRQAKEDTLAPEGWLKRVEGLERILAELPSQERT